jgi:putative oxidoreductase
MSLQNICESSRPNKNLFGEATLSSKSQSRLFIPAFGSLYESLGDWSEALLRVSLGAILMPHGMQKLFGWFGGMGLAGNAALFDKLGYSPGMFWGTLVGCTELIGGALLVLGLLTRPAAFAIAVFMLNAVWFSSMTGGFFWTSRGSEFAILLFFAALYFVIRGARTYSLDRAIGREF